MKIRVASPESVPIHVKLVNQHEAFLLINYETFSYFKQRSAVTVVLLTMSVVN